MLPCDARRGDALPRVKILADLRLALARIGAAPDRAAPERRPDSFALGAPELDGWLGGGLSCAALHEIHAASGLDWPAAAGFSLALALRAAPRRPVLWARQEVMESEFGRLNGMGLAAFGLDPSRLALTRGRDAEAVLRAGVEAARSKSLGAAVIEIYGAPRALDLTASLRLARAAQNSGVTLFLLRARGLDAQTGPPPSAAVSRWLAQTAASRPLPANAPGPPAFCVTLLRQRHGAANRSWRLEWRNDRSAFQLIDEADHAALSGPVPALAAGGAAAPPRRRAG